MDYRSWRRAQIGKLMLYACALFPSLLLSSAALGCDCPAATVQARSEQADTIVIVQVIGHRGRLRNLVSTDVKVVRSYKGSFSVGEKMVLGESVDAREDSCRIRFADEAPGGRWLIYARSAHDLQNGRWLIRNCGRSAPVEFAAHDIRYLDRIDKYRGRTRIYGFAPANYVSYADRSIGGAKARGPGALLTLTGENREFSVRAGRDGFFELLDVPAGLYTAKLQLPAGAAEWYINRAFYLSPSEYDSGTLKYGPFGLDATPTERERAEGIYTIQVPEKGDAEINFNIDARNRIRGRVFGPSGRPVPHALVSVVTYSPVTVRDYAVQADANGRYELLNHRTGNYVLGVNVRNSLTQDHPYGPLYYPGIKSRSRSRMIQIGIGTEIDDADLHIRGFKDVVTLSGRLVFADGQPVTDGFVRLYSDGNFQANYDPVEARVTKDGRFRLRVVKGEHGRLFGGVTMVSEGLAGCVNKTQPQVDNDYLKGFKRLFSREKNLIARRNISRIVLKFVEAPCR